MKQDSLQITTEQCCERLPSGPRGALLRRASPGGAPMPAGVADEGGVHAYGSAGGEAPYKR